VTKKAIAVSLLQIVLISPAALAVGFDSTGLSTTSAAFTSIGAVISTLVTASIIVAGLAAFLFLIVGGFQYLTSGGDKAAAQSARDRITYAIMGLAIVAAAVAIIQVLGAVFGFNITGTIKWPGPATTIGA